MKRKNLRNQGKGATGLLEEAIHVLRTAPLSTLALYYIGSLPYLLGLLYFWTDMLRSALAYRHCAEASLGITLLFLWMKSWQTIFTRQLLTIMHGIPQTWTVRRVIRLIVTQTILQPWGIWLLPLALLMTLPFPWMYAFFQNVTVFGDGEQRDVKLIIKKAWHQANLWKKQNLLLIWLLSPWLVVLAAVCIMVLIPLISATYQDTSFILLIGLTLLLLIPLSPLGAVIAVNIGGSMLGIPQLLKTFFGIETMFTLSRGQIFNTTFFAIVCALTYLCLDPLVKTAYTLRCFYGESLHTGEDLKVALRQIAALKQPGIIGLVLLAALCTSPSLQAAPLPEHIPAQTASQPASTLAVSAAELDESLDRVMTRIAYNWRLPREQAEKAREIEKDPPRLLIRIVQKLADWGRAIGRGISKLGKWLRKLFPERSSTSYRSGSDPDWMPRVQAFIYILLAGITCLLAIVLWRMWNRRRQQQLEVVAETRTPPLDLTDDRIDASELPEDGWHAMAKELFAKGELRLSLRAFYLASLSFLAQHQLLTIAKCKSDREYERELQRRAHALPAPLLTAFTDNISLFERAWYGMYDVTHDVIDQFTANYTTIKSGLTQRS